MSAVEDKAVTIRVNSKPIEVAAKTTGAEIKQKADVPEDFVLYERKGTHLDEVKNDQHIHVHPDEEFVAVSGQDVS